MNCKWTCEKTKLHYNLQYVFLMAGPSICPSINIYTIVRPLENAKDVSLSHWTCLFCFCFEWSCRLGMWKQNFSTAFGPSTSKFQVQSTTAAISIKFCCFRIPETCFVFFFFSHSCYERRYAIRFTFIQKWWSSMTITLSSDRQTSIKGRR